MPQQIEEKTTRAIQTRSLSTQAAIVEAALSEFANFGYDGATTRAIANRAGVNPALITHHFGGKEALWKEVAEHLFHMYRARVKARREGLAGIDEPTVIRLLLKEIVLIHAEVPDFHRFMMQANFGDPSRLAWLVDRFLKPGSELELGLLRQAQAQGVLLAGDLNHLRYLFLCAAASIFAFDAEFKLLNEKDPYQSSVIDKHVDLLLDLFAPRKDSLRTDSQ